MFLFQRLYSYFVQGKLVSVLENVLLVVQKWQDVLHMWATESLKKTPA